MKQIALFNTKPVLRQSIVDEIKRIRKQLLVWSCAYYELSFSIVSDKSFDSVARKLVDMQQRFPAESEAADHYQEFIGWDGTTGYHLPLRDPRLYSKTEFIIEMCKKKEVSTIDYT